MGMGTRIVAVAAAGALVIATVVAGTAPVAPAPPVAAAEVAPVPGSGADRPRVLYDPGSEPTLRDRLSREPYRTLFVRGHEQAAAWEGQPLGDLGVGAQRNLTRVALIRAFEYALDRTVVGGQVVAFPDAAARRAAGDQVRAILLQILDRSRLAVPPPIGGWDRDISTSEEIIGAAVAYDTLLAGGYALAPQDDAEIVRRIAAVTRELRLNFVQPSTASGYADLHQNNHRTKTGAALAVAAVVLADQVDDTRQWFDTGADYVDDTLRHTLATGDGAYAEGPFYYRYLTQNLVPYLAVWDRFLGDGAWTTEAGLEIPDLGATEIFARSQRWMLDTSVPDGTMAPIDDGNPGRSHFYGALPTDLPTTAAGYWQWARTPQPYDVEGNVFLGPFAIVAYDDAITPTPPDWDPTQVYVEGGTATLRGGWGADDAMALVLGEHDAASEFGRDRTGTGRWPQSHEHAEPGAFLFHAYGERLALDPGYLTFATHGQVNRPEHHNTVLVDGQGPPDYLQASIAWSSDLAGRPPAEGQSTLHHAVRSDVADAVSVASAYRGAGLDRRVVFGDDRYLVVADEVTAPVGTDLTWMLHGNGGGTSGGTYARSGTGGRWTVGGARLDSGIATTVAAPALAEADTVHEVPYTQSRTHTALAATTTSTAASTGAVQVLYPTPTGQAPPTITSATVGGHAVVEVDDPAGDRHLTVVRRGAGADDLVADGIGADGSLLVVERAGDGALRAVWADDATVLTDRATGTALVTADGPRGTLGLRRESPGTAHLTGTAPGVVVDGLGFTPQGADGACHVGSVTSPGDAPGRYVGLTREGTGTVRAAPATAGAPAADAGRDQRVPVGATARLDGRSSCDPDTQDPGAELAPRWELVSAPTGSAWSLAGSDSWRPTLVADRPGPYRVRLVVTDPTGRTSTEDEVEVRAGPQGADGVDDDLDGLIDSDDPDADGPPWPSATELSHWESYVTLLYRDLLGRAPSPADLAYWTDLYEAHPGGRSVVMSRFRRTPEVNGLVVHRVYEAYLGRRATSDEAAYWTGYLARGRTFEQLEVQVLAAPESRALSPTARAHVERVLGLLLGRAPTATELERWSARYARDGAGSALPALLRSPAVTQRRVTSVYAALLGRTPEADGLAYWAGRLQGGANAVSLVLTIASLDEYARRVPRSSGAAVLRPALVPGAG